MASTIQGSLERRNARTKGQGQRITELELEKEELKVYAQAGASEFKTRRENLREEVATLQQQCANA
jgi:FtsZ-binding cell division protein ZapB